MNKIEQDPVYVGPAWYENSGPFHLRECGLCNGWGRHDGGKCCSCRGIGWVLDKPKDRCTICRGEKGGVLGNENIIDGKLVCDYCS